MIWLWGCTQEQGLIEAGGSEARNVFFSCRRNPPPCLSNYAFDLSRTFLMDTQGNECKGKGSHQSKGQSPVASPFDFSM